MKTDNVLEYEDIPQVAMETMNGVHKEELEIVNNLYSAILVGNESKISLLSKHWLEHTKAHFDKENHMMEKYDFPAFHCHHGEHVEALEGLQTIIESWETEKDLGALTTYVTDIWPQWYVNHIASMDTVTSAFIKQSIAAE